MMSPETIRSMTHKAGLKAAQNDKRPYNFWDDQIAAMKVEMANGNIPDAIRRIPNLGEHVPDDMEVVDTHFVDASGFGADDEPALTVEQFINVLDSSRSYAITSVGQFQVYIGAFITTS